MDRSKVILLIWFCLGAIILAQGLPIPTQQDEQERAIEANRKLTLLKMQTSPIDYILGPGDLIEIQVLGVPELSKQLEISQTGEILLPFIDRVRVEGLNVFELQKKLEALLAQSVLQEPHVSVTIKEHRSQPVHILGAISSPGTYQLKISMRLIDLLSKAGGFTADAGSSCLITRSLADGKSERIEINLDSLLNGQDLSQNIPLVAGDMIHVSKRIIENFYILGDVGQPGAYPMPADREIYLSEAVSTAGGFLKTAKIKKSKLVRTQSDGQRLMVDLNIEKILSGKQPDILIKQNDLLFVPNSKSKTVGYGFLSGLHTLVYPLIWGIF